MPDEPHYKAALDAIIAQAGPLPPGLHIATVFHDAWCALLAETGPCNCVPEVALEELAE